MFSGLISDLGLITNQSRHSLWVQIPSRKIRKGDSIAVNGVCLTVAREKKTPGGKNLYFDLSEETLKKSNLALLKEGQKVNLERALTLNDALGGHIVQGHVDGVGKLVKIIKKGGMRDIWVQAPAALLKYIVPKGSVAVDGISLTAVNITRKAFSVSLIPYTLIHTTMGTKKPGETLNLEADIMAKYVMKYLKNR